MVESIKGELIENRIVVWDLEHSRALFKEGFYGKPLGIPKPKDAEFDAPLILDLIEGYYLAKKGRLEIYKRDGADSTDMRVKIEPLSMKEMASICRKEYARFDSKYMVFKELRDKGYVVTPGIKFGCDFAVYEHGPGIDHAPYLVQVVGPGDLLTATMIVLSGRLATTVRKQFILAVVSVKEKRVEFLAFDWWRA
ncbi:tRNA-splicing endonuclease [Candidatus Nitrosocaldus cavascurensis]|jgi:tRNA-intron endonuclease|uniref:tRNA-splicing endonuclease n=1 Tax=Candidatus Nitrosocaldus cavascurensis TaxID=2058097 RepID=A0A2K5AQ12_9ARCH|nr:MULTISPECIES: tRNA-intron lyase [Candidatus Nitrosocaldus]SPC33724.1 tRNA-splicing endonuclease [Candidatus Nitrosocaldus cavascurensis]